MKLFKSDIGKIGYAHFERDGFLHILTDSKACGVEEIILRNILPFFGKKIKITEVKDFFNGRLCDVEFVTNLPFCEYEKATQSNE